jgi:4-hydroxybenzoate polyprenyltransferase
MPIRKPAILKALFLTCHPLPSLAVTAMFTVLIARAAPHGIGPVAAIAAVLLGELSIGWSNDYFDAGRDAMAGRTDKPIVSGAIAQRTVLAAAVIAVAASVALAFSVNAACGTVDVAQMAAGWLYNAGLKITPVSGVAYAVGFGLIPEFATSTAPGIPAARPAVLIAAALLGVGGHLANALPDLDGDRVAGVRGLPNVLADRFGAGAVRIITILLLLGASGFLALSGSPWLWFGFAAAAVLAWLGLGGEGRAPFFAALAIAGIDVVMFVLGGVPLS